MARVLAENWPTDGPVKSEIQKLANKEWSSESEEDKSEAASEILARIEDTIIWERASFLSFLQTI